MEKHIQKHLLDVNCDAIEEQTYTRKFTAEELNLRKEKLAETSIEIQEVEEDKKKSNDLFKEQLKSLNGDKLLLVKELKSKSETVKEKCFKFLDHDERMAHFYNSEGELVHSRPIQPQEMQKSVFTLGKSGTDNI